MPNFVDVSMIDDVMVSSYNSDSQKMLQKQNWLEKVDQHEWDAETTRAMDTEKYLKAEIQSLKKRFNETQGELTHFYFCVCLCLTSMSDSL